MKGSGPQDTCFSYDEQSKKADCESTFKGNWTFGISQTNGY
ncbi:MAG: hypothetical protein ACLTAI_08290 [Thomasclavelia sp.]